MKNSVLNKAGWKAGRRCMPVRHLGIIGKCTSLLLLVCSCSTAMFPGYKNLDKLPSDSPVSWFNTDSGHFLFNTKIDVLKNHFSGLMVIKQMNRDTFRVVLITEVGLKVFDMEFCPNKEAKVHYIMDAMNKKVLVKTLSNDISLLLMNNIAAARPHLLKDKKSGNDVFRYVLHGKKSYYYLSAGNPHPTFVKQSGAFTNKVRAEIYGNRNTGVDSVKLRHYNIKLAINLYRITEENSHATE